MLDKLLEQIKHADLQELIQEKWLEGKAIDYKRDMYGGSDSHKKELLKDVSSFANTDGGDLIIGVDEAGGLPTAIPGVAVADVDAEKLRLEETIRRGIEPRIDFAIHAVDAGSGTVVFIIRVRESWILPHRVVYQGKFGEFFARNSAGTYSMDTTELRRAFNLSESIYERVRSFRKERVDEIIKGNGPLPLKEGAKLILHLIPLESFRSKTSIDFRRLLTDSRGFPPIGHLHIGGWEPRLNFDGLLIFRKASSPNSFNTYVQIYRNGIVEAALDTIGRKRDESTFLATDFCETSLLNSLPLYFKGLMSLSIRPPILAFLSLTGVEGFLIHPGTAFIDLLHPIDRDVLHLPEIQIEDLNQSVTELLRPTFDLIWNSAGFPQSLTCDERGKTP
jgi:hypothetical protein